MCVLGCPIGRGVAEGCAAGAEYLSAQVAVQLRYGALALLADEVRGGGGGDGDVGELDGSHGERLELRCLLLLSLSL
eukprot:CAMPEP_0173325872 /NCGR_PEP_ID=MMETSP1144-20121109/756_1 /TAXON_ID=483371 /ORGANISM="non described non described, Strain CCMP2298" /LENGTH=76 /DNA_ID=CAMNT_0014270129 /DNA_START=532 /DNA_END=759 /DNA_ORIENTATION=+